MIRIQYRPGVRCWETNTDLALDVGQNLSPSLVKAQRTRRATKAFALKVPQQIEHRRRP
jgi:hypothetical protein